MSILVNFDIDENKSRQQADKLLKQYWRIKHISTSASSLKSPSYSHTPKSFSSDNATENRSVKTIEARRTLENINVALDQLEAVYSSLLKMCYLSIDRPTVIYMCHELRLGETSFRKYKKQALLEFAESYPSDGILIFKE